jgi:hypothetical protein
MNEKLKVVPKRKRIIFYKILREIYNAPYCKSDYTFIKRNDHVIEAINNLGFCFNTKKINEYLNIPDFVKYKLEIFPELFKYKPNETFGGRWFSCFKDGYLQRQKIINQVCKDLKI